MTVLCAAERRLKYGFSRDHILRKIAAIALVRLNTSNSKALTS